MSSSDQYRPTTRAVIDLLLATVPVGETVERKARQVADGTEVSAKQVGMAFAKLAGSHRHSTASHPALTVEKAYERSNFVMWRITHHGNDTTRAD